jgi:D-alanine-D-alanine ligase
MKKKIAVTAGGDSGEYVISMRSATVVAEALASSGYEVYLVQVKGADWFVELDGTIQKVDKNDFSLSRSGEKIVFDCVFCAIHGTPGENGKLPAYFEMLGIPFTAAGSFTSALTFHKSFCNHVVKNFGVLTPRSVLLDKNEVYELADLLETLSLPVFVKPNAGGSSVGMTKVKVAGELGAAIQRAFEEDDEVLVEEFIEGRELTCGVIETSGKLIVLPLCEIVSKKEFFDFEAKYDPALAEEIVPAPIADELTAEIGRVSEMLYRKLNCRGVVRFDYIHQTKTNKLFFLEVNTVPGLTAESIVPKMARGMNISLQQLFTMMVEDAIGRGGK